MRKIFLSSFIVLLSFLSCSIEDYIYFHEPTQLLHAPYSLEDALNSYVKLRLPDSENFANEPLYFKGYAIYYKIYNNENDKNSEISDIASYTKNYPTTAHNYVVNTKKYQRMDSSARVGNSPLIPSDSNDRDLYIRLSHYEKINPCVLVGQAGSIDTSNPTLVSGGSNFGIPLRSKDGITNVSDSTYRFEYDQIKPTDPDVRFTSQNEPYTWYVQLYIFTYGLDTSYQSLYSIPFSLSSFVIKA